MIKDSMTQQVKYDIPEWIMTSKYEPYINVAHRFKWIDNNTIRVINTEGIEQLVDISNKFKEIEFNVIPIYEE